MQTNWWEDLKRFYWGGAGGSSVVLRGKKEGELHDRWTHVAAQNNWPASTVFF